MNGPAALPGGSVASLAALAAPSDPANPAGGWFLASALVGTDGAPMANATVTFSTTGGALAQTSVTTDAQGIASTTISPPAGGSAVPVVAVTASAGGKSAVINIAFGTLATSSARHRTSTGTGSTALIGFALGQGVSGLSNPLYSPNMCHIPASPSPACQPVMSQQQIATTTVQHGPGFICTQGKQIVQTIQLAGCIGTLAAINSCLVASNVGDELAFVGYGAALSICSVALTATGHANTECLKFIVGLVAQSVHQELLADSIAFVTGGSLLDGFLTYCDLKTETINQPLKALSFSLSSQTSFTTSAAGFQPTLTATGADFNGIRSITFRQAGATNSGPYVWSKDDTSWGNAKNLGKLVQDVDNSMTMRPVVTKSTDRPGISTWTIDVTDGTTTKSTQFTIDYEPGGLSFTLGAPTSFSTSSVLYQPTLSGTGSGFNAVNTITFTQAGAMTSGPYTWTKNNSSWNTALNEGKLAVSDNSITMRPVVTQNGDNGGVSTWTVTLSDGTTSKPQTFTVNYTKPGALTFSLAAPTSFSTSALNYQPTLTGTGSGFTAVNTITFTQAGAMTTGPYTWTKSNSSWNTALNAGKLTVTNDGSITMRPVVTQYGDTGGVSTWTVTLSDGTTSQPQTFTVNYIH